MLITQDAYTTETHAHENVHQTGTFVLLLVFNLIVRGAKQLNENNIHNTRGSEKIFVSLKKAH